MMTYDITICPNCKNKRALTHYSSCGTVNWIACPKCRKYFEFGEEVEMIQGEKFWKNVEEDTRE